MHAWYCHEAGSAWRGAIEVIGRRRFVCATAALLAGAGRAGAATTAVERRTGSRFRPLPADPWRAPRTRVLDVPHFADANSIWGATGRDVAGRIWLGVSAKAPGGSAHLMRFDPESDQWRDLGSVVERLAEAGALAAGAGQVKIHSKIVPGEDGGLYFTSMDEEGEVEDGSALPKWGSHLWRIDAESGRWRHLFAAPEGLVAAAGGGRWIYALGYWDHVLYRFDTVTGEQRRVVVGAVGGHASRNMIAGSDGHAFVPRVTRDGYGTLRAALVEFDVDLRVRAATPLEFYFDQPPSAEDHGVVGLSALADGRSLFTTHAGHLYAIEPREGAAARITALGWFHPDGASYAPSLFALDGRTLVAGVARRADRYEWIVFDLASRASRAFPFDTHDLPGPLLYGSITRDDAGRCYVGGWQSTAGGGHRPLLLQVDVE
jgi:outer membrane protein assembly factor BamB